jgi:hypothetical protein
MIISPHMQSLQPCPVAVFELTSSYSEYIGRASVSLTRVPQAAPALEVTLPLRNDSPHGRALELHHLLQLRRRSDPVAAEFLKSTKGEFQSVPHK